MNALPLVNLELLIRPYLAVFGSVFVGLFIALFFVDHQILKKILGVVVGLSLLSAGGFIAYMALSSVSVCRSGQASTSAALEILQNCQKSGVAYLLLLGFMGLMGLCFVWMGTWFFRPTRFTPPVND